MPLTEEKLTVSNKVHRREFLTTSSKATLGLSAGVTILADGRSARGAVANDKISLAMIGVGRRGNKLAAGFLERDDCEVTHVCDVNTTVGTERTAEYTAAQGGKQVQYVKDYRDLLQQESIDAVVIATPDHWHSPLTVFSCQAGKDVYVEKPVSHNPWEGQQAVKAARKYERIVQVGTQSLSAPYVHAAKEFIDEGRLGKIHLCRVYNQKGPMGNIDSIRYEDPPSDLNWDLWNGPAPASDYSRQLMNWHAWWRYSGGDLANDGVHQLDLARWMCGVGCPKGARAAGGVFASRGMREVPDTLVGSYDFDGMMMTIDDTHFGDYMLKSDMVLRESDIFPHWPQNSTRIEIYGTEGLMCLGRHGGGWQVFVRPQNRQPVVKEQMYGRFPDADHKENFLSCLRTRRRPNADILEGHLSALLVHYANISYRLGGENLRVDPKTERIVDNADAMKLFRREYRAPYTIEDDV
jgi:predicted dehydrogenase